MKRVLATLMTVLMLLVVMPAGAVQSTEDEVQSNGMRFALALGIMDETYQPSEALTRRQLAECYYNIIVNHAEITGFGDNIFTDVEDVDRSAVALCYNTGIMTGTGNGTFSPDEPVTYIQLIKTMVVFLGYETRAIAEGGYPYGYITVASSLGLYRNPPETIEAYVTANKAAELFRSSIDVPLMKRITYGSEEYEVKYGDTWMNLYRDMVKYRGTVKANHMTDLGGREPLDYDRIIVDGTEFELSQAAIELKNYIGYRVDIYVDTTEEPEKIVYWELLTAEKIVIDGSDVIGYADHTITYYGDTKTNYIRLNDETWVTYNGSFCSSYNESIINPFADNYLDGGITAVDNNGDGIFDFIEIDAYDTYVVSNIMDGKIFNEYRKDTVVDTSVFNEEKMMITNVVGDEMWLSEIMPGDIISVSRDLNGHVKRIVVTIDTLKGKITEMSLDGGMSITIDGVTYDCSNSLALNPQLSDVTVGDTVKVFFNKDGEISDIEAEQYRTYRLGYLTDASAVSAIDTRYEVKLFTSEEEFVIYPVAQKVEVEGVGNVKAAEAVELAGKTDSGRVMRQLIQYNINMDTGELNYIDFCDGTEPCDSLYRYDDYKGLYYRDSAMSFSGKLLLTSDTVLFNVPLESDRDNDEAYYLSSVNFATGTNYASGYNSFEAYGNDKMSRRAIAMVLESSGAAYPILYSTELFLVDKISSVISADGDSVLKLTGVCYGQQQEFLAEPGILQIAPDGGLPSKGDVIRISSDAKGQVRNAEFIFNEDDRTLYGMNNPSDALSASKRYAYGKVIYSDEGYITIEVNGQEETHQLGRFRLGCYKKNAEDGVNAATVSVGASTDVYDEYHYPTMGSMVLIHTDSCVGKSIIIYND